MSLAGPRHQRMMQMLQEQAGAQHMQSVIDDDGTYRVVLAPVADFSSFARTVNLGTVSAVDAQARTFTLTIDPARVPDVADPAVPAFGAPPGTGPGFLPGNPGPGSSARPPASDRVVYATITWQRYSGPKPGDGARTVVTQLAAYVPDSLSVDETAMSMTFQHRGPLDAAAVSHMLAASGFGRTIVRTSTNPPRSDP
jgi:hypothetical protein